MRALAQGGFTEAEILTRLKSGEGIIGPKYQIVDIAGNVLETLPTGETGIISGTITQNFDNDIKSQLRLTMRPVASLNTHTVAFKRWIRPSFRLQMLNGTVLEWRMGDFLWVNPSASFWRNDELWEMDLGDRTQWCDYCSVPTSGFTAPQGSSNFTALMNQLLGLCGLPQNFPATTAGTSATKTWSLTMPRQIKQWESQARSHQRRGTRYGQRRAKQIQKKIDSMNLTVAPTTILAIMNELCFGIPANDLMFTYTNAPTLGYTSPVGALAAGPLFAFDLSWLRTAVETSINSGGICNRFAGISQSGSATFLDANVEYPSHPIRQSVIGRYIDNAAVNPGPVSATTFARRQLIAALNDYELVSFDAHFHPGIELCDVVSLHVPEKASFATPQKVFVRQLEFDLDTGVMGLQGSHVFQ